jgi:hypothetical protein
MIFKVAFCSWSNSIQLNSVLSFIHVLDNSHKNQLQPSTIQQSKKYIIKHKIYNNKNTKNWDLLLTGKEAIVYWLSLMSPKEASGPRRAYLLRNIC